MNDFIAFLISLNIPLYATSQVFRDLFTAIAMQFNKLDKTVIKFVSQGFPQDTSLLEHIAKDRDIVRLQGESEASYRNRVTYAYLFRKQSATNSGITALIQRITNKPFVIRELFRETWVLGNVREKLGKTTILGSPLDRFFFIVAFQTSLMKEERTYIQRVIHLYKPAHSGFIIKD
ncbi:hypothetical protein SAMN02745150_01198 [Brevinema andersonii]|uniref:Uncharacterized protein n=1 Tax=Brevinema andersonii TaxID=34097 RepID=A0A1I1EUR1_BREAD|nr:hypothetical protein [Brevinema andersonii]SFB88670.1 hypothetical protein SAMN02745150_01198 [Brevinema andersonii]